MPFLWNTYARRSCEGRNPATLFTSCELKKGEQQSLGPCLRRGDGGIRLPIYRWNATRGITLDASRKRSQNRALKAHRPTITPRIRTDDVPVLGLPNNLAATEIHVTVFILFEFVTAFGQFFAHGGGRPRL
jgi:hypothetical protein